MRPKKNPWTTEENERLKTMIAKGISPFRVSAAFGRNLISVRAQARKLGLAFPSIRQSRLKLFKRLSMTARFWAAPKERRRLSFGVHSHMYPATIVNFAHPIDVALDIAMDYLKRAGQATDYWEHKQGSGQQ
jgi:hypothetical protein